MYGDNPVVVGSIGFSILLVEQVNGFLKLLTKSALSDIFILSLFKASVSPPKKYDFSNPVSNFN